MWYILLFMCAYCAAQEMTEYQSMLITRVKPTITQQAEFCRQLSNERLNNDTLKPFIEPYIFSYVTRRCNGYQVHKNNEVLYHIINGQTFEYAVYENVINDIMFNATREALLHVALDNQKRVKKSRVVLSAGLSSVITALITGSVALITHFTA